MRVRFVFGFWALGLKLGAKGEAWGKQGAEGKGPS